MSEEKAENDTRRIVYVITEGSYSDYGIVSMWMNKEDAEKVCAARKDECAMVEEWPLNESVDITLRMYEVWQYADRDLNVIEHGVGTEHVQGSVSSYPNGCYQVCVAATTITRARKIASDLITQKKARDAGIS